ncbi:hypothetical protein ACROYT_G001673 [Oculina patagonica]
MSASGEIVLQNAEKALQTKKHPKENTKVPMTCAAEVRTYPAAFSLVEPMTVPGVIGCTEEGPHCSEVDA